MKFLVLSRREIKKYYTSENHIVISITDPELKFERLPEMDSRKGAMFLRFPDFDRPVDTYPYNYMLFNPQTASSIWNFFNEFKSKISLVICQCEAGISRSAGIASALCKAIGQDDSEFFKKYIPNRLVYRLILEEAFR